MNLEVYCILCTPDRMQQAQVKYEVCQVTVTLAQLVRNLNMKMTHEQPEPEKRQPLRVGTMFGCI